MIPFSKYRDIIQRVTFTTFQSQIESWSRQGISHGFEGIGAKVECHHPQQVHGIQFLEAGETNRVDAEHRPEADGIWTNQPGVKVGIKTADCVPVLFFGESMVMAVHAGWRGLFSGIIAEALQQFPSRDRVLVGIGPCISAHSFEVGPELIPEMENLALDETAFSICSSPGVEDRWHLDLSLLVVFALIQEGVQPEQITCQRGCTKLSQGWNSYRRDGKAAGRNWSWIARPL